MHLFESQHFRVITTQLKNTDMHDLNRIYQKVYTTLQGSLEQYFVEGENLRYYPNQPKMTDLEILSPQ
jgi:hypothetical protein